MLRRKRWALGGLAAALGTTLALSSAWACRGDRAPEADLGAAAAEFSHVHPTAPFAVDESWLLEDNLAGSKLRMQHHDGFTLAVAWSPQDPQLTDVRTAWTTAADPGKAGEWRQACAALARMISQADARWNDGSRSYPTDLTEHCEREAGHGAQGVFLPIASGVGPERAIGGGTTSTHWWAAEVARDGRVLLIFELEAAQVHADR